MKISNFINLSLRPKLHNSPTPFKANNEGVDEFVRSGSYLDNKKAAYLKEQGNEFFTTRNYDKAINIYKRAIELKPNYTDALYNIATCFNLTGKVKDALESYKKIVKLIPNDIEAMTYMGKCHLTLGDYENSKNSLSKVLQMNPKYDLAHRYLLEAENKKLARTNPVVAKRKKELHKQKNLQAAINMVFDNLSDGMKNKIKDVTFEFGVTKTANDPQNIAHYEHARRKVVITDEYIWAAPEVIAAYVMHEVIHAADNDSYTSVQEENDAYVASIKFWQKHSKEYEDPEMNYATELYEESPEKLKNKIRAIYKGKDGHIPEYSNHHRGRA